MCVLWWFMLCSGIVVCVGGRRGERKGGWEVLEEEGAGGCVSCIEKKREKEKEVEQGKSSNGRAWTYFC